MLAKQWVACSLEQVFHITERYKVMHFALPSPDATLGLPLGQNIKIRCQEEEIQATPISPETAGVFEILVPTQTLSKARAGARAEFKGPYGGVVYQGDGRWEIHGEEFQYRQVGCVVEDLDIAKVYQLIQQPGVSWSLVLHSDRESHIALRPELEDMAADQLFHLYYTLEVEPEGWAFEALSQELLEGRMPEELVVYAGGQRFVQRVERLLADSSAHKVLLEQLKLVNQKEGPCSAWSCTA